MNRALTKLIIHLLSKLDNRENPKADMYQPIFTKLLGIFLIPFGLIISIFSFRDNVMYIAYLIGIPFMLCGLFILLFGNRQQINIITSNEFEYTNIFGKKSTHRFSDIQNMLIENDSSGTLAGRHNITIILPEKRIKISAESLITKRLWDILIAKYKELNNEIQ